MTCPHKNKLFCPIYHASHDSSIGVSCDDGRLGEGGCAADRQLNYLYELARLETIAPRIKAECEWREAETKTRDQRNRTMRLLGLK
jgi:hypothetical protein